MRPHQAQVSHQVGFNWKKSFSYQFLLPMNKLTAVFYGLLYALIDHKMAS